MSEIICAVCGAKLTIVGAYQPGAYYRVKPCPNCLGAYYRVKPYPYEGRRRHEAGTSGTGGGGANVDSSPLNTPTMGILKR